VKRVTVSITVQDDYNSSGLRRVKAAMIEAAVSKASEQGFDVMGLEGRVGTTRRRDK